MRFSAPLHHGTLIERYKRFMADVNLDTGEIVTAHCANPGSMLGLKEPGMEVWLSPADNPKRKLKYTWELVRDGGAMVGVNTMHPNQLAVEAVEDGTIPELAGYATLRREVRYGENSRIDILLTGAAKPDCYVEIKNVHLKRGKRAEFPDAVTARGTKHLGELSAMAAAGARAVMLYLVQRDDCDAFAIADDIDPAYASALTKALGSGVEAICYACQLTPEEIAVDNRIPIEPSPKPAAVKDRNQKPATEP